ncbi:hypothetical protein MHF_0613 [Mycoplasma haemofelis Ohio2]|uniref:Uncharacterized protein n=1 Tax=Mycoplasma haemofelis (strain Ohio2) TaxID=859194 RepID=F6FI37_MYCHI|nr:hypothetical protein MHF_0613 [Mycoplasma haemofelis Ohio2]
MATALAKAAMASGAAGVTGASGFGIYKQFFSGVSIRDTILNSKEHSNKWNKFLEAKDPKWSGIQEEYGKSNSKPTDSDGKEIKKEDLPSWCVSESGKDYSGKEDSIFKAILRWCYVNTNNFGEQVKALGRELVGDESDDTNAWKAAWNKYKDKKSQAQWKITGSSDDTKLNGDKDTDGSPILKTWCSNQKSVAMYANGAEDTFSKFKEFCLK